MCVCVSITEVNESCHFREGLIFPELFGNSGLEWKVGPRAPCCRSIQNMLVITVVIMPPPGFLYLSVHARMHGHLWGNYRTGADRETGVSKCRPVSVPEGQHSADMCSATADKEPGGKSG